jgi:hypothetical protein
MRAALRSFSTLSLVVAFGGCAEDPAPPGVDSTPDQLPAGTTPGAPGGPGTARPGTTTPTTPVAADPKALLQEVVYVLMRHYDGDNWMCTGTLIAKDTVVTAAHCLNEEDFESWEIVAPLAKNKPRVSASNPKLRSYDWDPPGNPDIGFLTLDEPIALPAYAQLTDVSARVARGEKIVGVTLIRQEEELEAPFKAVESLAVSSTLGLGYDHGFATKYFSKGGDSGAGLFLVENGAPTHKLIAVARNPDPDEDLDHFTRIDDDFLRWLEAGGHED